MRLIAFCLVAVTLAIGAPAHAATRQIVREQRTVIIHGEKETWRLIWDGKPKTLCGPDDVDGGALTCPCSGWAYAERGKLSLVRSRGKHDIDRLDLIPLFGQFDYPSEAENSAYVQRWPPKKGDFARAIDGDPTLTAEIKKRPAPVIMNFADYNRDGLSAKFLVQVGTMPCGKHQFAAVGITKANPHLHALASVAHPKTPLMMPLNAWQALLKSPDPTVVSIWDCGDHGSEERREFVVSADSGDIRVKDRLFSCPADNQPEMLVEETDE